MRLAVSTKCGDGYLLDFLYKGWRFDWQRGGTESGNAAAREGKSMEMKNFVFWRLYYASLVEGSAKQGREREFHPWILFLFVKFWCLQVEWGHVTERRKFCFLCSVNAAARQGRSMEMKNFVFWGLCCISLRWWSVFEENILEVYCFAGVISFLNLKLWIWIQLDIYRLMPLLVFCFWIYYTYFSASYLLFYD